MALTTANAIGAADGENMLIVLQNLFLTKTNRAPVFKKRDKLYTQFSLVITPNLISQTFPAGAVTGYIYSVLTSSAISRSVSEVECFF